MNTVNGSRTWQSYLYIFFPNVFHAKERTSQTMRNENFLIFACKLILKCNVFLWLLLWDCFRVTLSLIYYILARFNPSQWVHLGFLR